MSPWPKKKTGRKTRPIGSNAFDGDDDQSWPPEQISLDGSHISSLSRDSRISEKFTRKKDVEKGTRVQMPPPIVEKESSTQKTSSSNSGRHSGRHLWKNPMSCNFSLPSKKNLYFIVGVSLTVVILIGVVTASLVTRNNNNGPDTPAPTLPPVMTMDYTPRVQALMDIFRVISPVGLDDIGSPQFRAMEWMIGDDPLELDPSSTASTERVTQRYALAVFFFSTNGTTAWPRNNWLGEDECSNMYWDGISCTDDNYVRAIAFGKLRRVRLDILKRTHVLRCCKIMPVSRALSRTNWATFCRSKTSFSRIIRSLLDKFPQRLAISPS